jgi:hypothetical protein
LLCWVGVYRGIYYLSHNLILPWFANDVIVCVSYLPSHRVYHLR